VAAPERETTVGVDVRGFWSRFWQPPRPHGQSIVDRRVSYVELFYDLVFVVVIARASATLAHDVSARAVLEYVVIFGLVWVAWLNGSMYHELHGREDGRSRTFIFVQVTILSVLAVYAATAAGSGGVGFALAYVVLLVVLAWLWLSVRRRDEEQYQRATGSYLLLMAASMVAIGGSALLADGPRLVVWAAVVVAWVGLGIMRFWVSGSTDAMGVTVTDSMVERFGLFVIIVLGEVVVGVVEGMSETELDPLVVTTAVLALIVGSGFWWAYFDLVGGRLPVSEGLRPGFWLYGQLPVALVIAASGAAMVGLIEHAGDDHAPAANAWLLGGGVAVLLVVLIGLAATLRTEDRVADRPLALAMALGACGALVVAAVDPPPWLLAAALVAILAAVWFFGALRSGASAAPSPSPSASPPSPAS
jgi:low temperature requirement protein LtrA